MGGAAAAVPEEVRRAFLIMAGIDEADLDSDDALLGALREANTAFGGLSADRVRAIAKVVAHFAELMRTPHRHSTVMQSCSAPPRMPGIFWTPTPGAVM